MGVWGISLLTGLFLVSVPEQPLEAAALFAVRVLSGTGLFITAHDAVHGTLSRNRRLGDAIGAVCLRLFAMMPWRRIRDAHHAHHNHVATGLDPDFHDGEHRGFGAWLYRFFRGYVTGWQLTLIFSLLCLWFALGAPVENIFLFSVLPAWASVLQLFIVGTYLPHRHAGLVDGEAPSRTLRWPRGLSLLGCFHFGYHAEHHAHPGVPWWRLPQLVTTTPRDQPGLRSVAENIAPAAGNV
jgi:beta-carotene/zeaxanthin 4-ketolase